MERYFRNADGSYKGSVVGDVPDDWGNVTEVPFPPAYAAQVWNGTDWGAYQPTLTLNQQLETTFLAILPKHLGQPYCTGAVITTIMQAKVAVTDANVIDGTGALAKSIISSLVLPSEMETDRQNLLSLIP